MNNLDGIQSSFMFPAVTSENVFTADLSCHSRNVCRNVLRSRFPVSCDSVAVETACTIPGPEADAAKRNSALTCFIINTCTFPTMTNVSCKNDLWQY